MYDVVIIGGGVSGCFIAKELAKYQAKVIILEKNNDICSETTMANSAIVHSGYDPKPGTLKAKLNVLGNAMFDEICKELDVEFFRIGSLTLAFNDEDINTLKQLQERGRINGVETEIISKEEVKRLEPNINDNVKAALYAPTCGIINPFELTVALAENAMDNGVELALNNKVITIKKVDDHYEVTTNEKVYKSKIVINAAGVYSDEVAGLVEQPTFKIRPRKGSYFVLDHFDKTFVSHTIFMVPTNKGKGVLVTPTTHFNYIVGPSSEFVDSKEDTSTDQDTLSIVKENAKNIINNVPYNQLIRTFSGLRAVSDNDDFIIEESKVNKGFIHVAGIQSPGLAASPAIAKMVENIVLEIHNFPLKDNYNKYRRPWIKMSRLSEEEKAKLIANNPQFGRIICRCEKVSEGEIVDVIHRNAGARTVKGVKKRIRPGFGKCQGAFCQPYVVDILARELKVDPSEINFDALNTPILKYRTKK
jgi:glycerol-3-phosphate dehydrogenase